MNRRSWQVATLLPATLTMGLTAGVFGDWAHTIMPGLGTTDDRTFVGAFQALDRAILNPLFMLTFMGALAFTGVAAVLYLRGDSRAPLPWVATAFGLYLAAFVITMAVHEPLNSVLGPPVTPTASPTRRPCATLSTRPAGSPGTSSGPLPPRPPSDASAGPSSSTDAPPPTPPITRPPGSARTASSPPSGATP